MDGISTIAYLTKVSFGFGASEVLPEVLAELAIARPFVVTDAGVRATGVADSVVSAAADPESAAWFDRTPPNPTEAAVLEATEAFGTEGCDGIVAIGGGSSIDLAKGVALLATHPAPLIDYAAVNGGMERITSRVVPIVAIPTTAGTGSEVGRAAMINVGGRKARFHQPAPASGSRTLRPGADRRLAALPDGGDRDGRADPLRRDVSLAARQPARGGDRARRVERAASSIEEATTEGRSRRARWNMLMASMEGALTFQKGLGAVHAMAHPLGALDDLPLHHGTLNAVLLPAVLRFNEPAASEKYARLRHAVGAEPDADLAQWVADLNARLGLPGGSPRWACRPRSSRPSPRTPSRIRPPRRTRGREPFGLRGNAPRVDGRPEALEHLLRDGRRAVEPLQREGLDRTLGLALDGKVGGDPPDRRPEREPVAAQTGDENEAVRPGASVEDGQSIRRHVDDAGPVAGDAHVPKAGDDAAGRLERCVHQLAVRSALDGAGHVRRRAHRARPELMRNR